MAAVFSQFVTLHKIINHWFEVCWQLWKLNSCALRRPEQPIWFIKWLWLKKGKITFLILNFLVSFGKTPALGCSTLHGGCSPDIHWLTQMPGIVTRHIPAKHLHVTQQINTVSFTWVPWSKIPCHVWVFFFFMWVCVGFFFLCKWFPCYCFHYYL